MSYSSRSKLEGGGTHGVENEEPSNPTTVTRKITHHLVRLHVNSRYHSESVLRAKMIGIEPSHAGKMAGLGDPSVEKAAGIP